MTQANPAVEAAESVSSFIDTEAEALEPVEYAEFLEELLADVQSRLDAARWDLFGG
jgi:hypothetical protein